MMHQFISPVPADCVGVCRYSDCLPLLACSGVRRLAENSRSVIVVLFPYFMGEYPQRNLSRYAVVQDYHRVAGGYLKQLASSMAQQYPHHSFVPFVDNSPIREVSAANLAGLGVVGQNGQLIHHRFGSMVFIGTVVTTLDIAPSQPSVGGCLECGICVKKCPTQALHPIGPLDLQRCRSHITQKKGQLTAWEEEQIVQGGMAWGCDICTDVCPMNRDLPLTPIPEFYEQPQPTLTYENIDELLTQKPYGYRGKKTLLRNLLLIENTANTTK